MIITLAALLLMQEPTELARQSLSDSSALAVARNREDSTRILRRMARRIPLTSEHVRTAFRDPLARDMLLAARAARVRQDSSLVSYDATGYQRLSVGMGFKQLGRDRLFLRSEHASRVRWSRDAGAWIDILGKRAAFPMVREAEGDANLDPSIPYFPGRETLWIGSGLVKSDVDPTEFIHPLANGAEAYYRYSTGDSLTMELGGGKAIRLRELEITARKPQWNLIVGSFWFDAGSGQLVRAAYRPSITMDLLEIARDEDPEDEDDIPIWVKPLITPLVATVSGITVEFGLYNGFWLPRQNSVEASARAGFMRLPVRFEERFRYASVNALDTVLSPVTVRAPIRRDTMNSAALDSLDKAIAEFRREVDDEREGMQVMVRIGGGGPQADSVRQEISERAREVRRAPPETRDSLLAEFRRMRESGNRDSVRAVLLEARRNRKTQCDTSSVRVSTYTRYQGGLKVAQRVPCDESVLANSPELPPSIYDPGEELFGTAERDELMKSLDLGLQAGWGIARPTLRYGFADGVWRYNRVEGVSLGLAADMALGSGYTVYGKARYAFASRQPSLELGFTRSNGRRTLGINAYKRLAAANDWGSPFSFGSSFAAMLYGRDEGFYYRTDGAELLVRSGTGRSLEWRAFAERQRTAPWNTSWSLLGGRNDSSFIPNFSAIEGEVAGLELRSGHSFGTNPDGFRLVTDLRMEGGAVRAAAAPDVGYGRAAFDFSVSRPIARRLAASVSGSAGASAGTLPPQRLWRLGGLQSVRGQTAGTITGDAFWLGHVELGTRRTGIKPVLFYDVGWAGSRDSLGVAMKPISGAGVGASALDGLLRLDVSRGIWPSTKYRVDFYVEARF
jgi:hypothetical protein